MSQVVIENPIISSPFDDAKCLCVPTLDEAGFRKLLSRNAVSRPQRLLTTYQVDIAQIRSEP